MIGTISTYAGGIAGTTNSVMFDVQLPPSTTAERKPASFAGPGMWYWDTTLMQTLYWFTGNVWRDGGGTAR